MRVWFGCELGSLDGAGGSCDFYEFLVVLGLIIEVWLLEA